MKNATYEASFKGAEFLADSLEQDIEILLQEKSAAALRRKVEGVGRKEHFLGVAVYGDLPAPLAMTTSLETQIAARPGVVAKAMGDDRGASQFVRMGSALMHLHAVPLHGDTGVIGGLLVVHDASYIASASRRIWREISVRVGVQICLLALTTFVVFRRSVMKPIARTAAWMRDLRNGRTPAEGEPPASDMFGPLAREATSFAKSLADARASAQQEARLRETGRIILDSGTPRCVPANQVEGQPAYCGFEP